jgi:hypothetical protein
LELAWQQGKLIVTRAYGNFANARYLGEAAQALFLLGVQLIHCPAWRNGSDQLKSTADEMLMNDARTLLLTEEQVSRFIIASGGVEVPLFAGRA